MSPASRAVSSAQPASQPASKPASKPAARPALQRDIAEGLAAAPDAVARMRWAREGNFGARTQPVFVSRADLADELAHFAALEARCSSVDAEAFGRLCKESKRLRNLHVVDAQEWLASAPGMSSALVSRWQADLTAVCAERATAVHYIQCHAYSEGKPEALDRLVDVRAHYHVLDAAALAVSLLAAQALGTRHGFDVHDVLLPQYQLRKLQTNNQWNNVALDPAVYRRTEEAMAGLVAISQQRVSARPESYGVLRWPSVADALQVHIASQSVAEATPDFPPTVEWAAAYEPHVQSFLDIADVQTARDTRLLMRILRSDRQQRLLSRGLLDRCTAAVYESSDRDAEYAFMQSFMEPAKRGLLRSVLLGEPEDGRYDFMLDADTRTGYDDGAKAGVEAELLLATPPRRLKVCRPNRTQGGRWRKGAAPATS